MQMQDARENLGWFSLTTLLYDALRLYIFIIEEKEHEPY